jgi:hypothetical protein
VKGATEDLASAGPRQTRARNGIGVEGKQEKDFLFEKHSNN